MKTVQQQARNVYAMIPMPMLRYGLGIWIDLSAFNGEKVLKEKQDAISEIRVPKGVSVTKLSSHDKTFREKYREGLLKHDENKFTALLYSLLKDATVIRIPKGTTVQTPIYIHSKAHAEKIIIIAEPHTKITIIEISDMPETLYFKGQSIDVYAEEGAHVYFYAMQDLDEETYNFSIKRGYVQSRACIDWTDVTLGSKVTMQHTCTFLSAPEAHATKKSMFIGSAAQQFDINDEMIHEAPQTKAHMQSRGVLNDRAKTIYRGKIKIKREAPQCVSQQKADNLLLTEYVRCNAVPILEVDNDNVICSHGATFKKIDDEQEFYLNTRGVDKEQAKEMIVKGFVDELINEIPDETIKEKIQKRIEEKIKATEHVHATDH